MKILLALLFLTLFVLPVSLQAQNIQSDTIQETNKSFVSIPVTVSDRENRYVAGLKKEDFSVYLDEVKQKITSFSKYNEPLNIVLLLDTSKSTRDVIGKIKDAAKDFIDTLKKNDQCQVATFDSDLNIINPFTSNHEVIKNSLNKIKVNNVGGTLMFSAVNQVIQKSFDDAKDRKIIILLTDGNDFGSSISKDNFLNQLEESDILIYTVFFNTGENSDKSASSNGKIKKKKKSKKEKRIEKMNRTQVTYSPTSDEIKNLEQREERDAIDSLKAMSDITAGRFYQSSVPDLKKIFKKITGELSQQYRLGFKSKVSAADSDAHNISVKVERPDVVVRTRETFRNKKQ